MAAAQQKRAPYRETKRLKPEQRKRMILDAASSLLIEQGYARLTLRSVAEQAGIRLATLQYYFATSEVLFQAAFRDIAETAWNDLLKQTELKTEDAPEDRLHSFLQGMFETTRDQALAGFFSELWARARLDEFAAEIAAEYYSDAIDLLAGMIGNCRPGLSVAERQRRATLLIALVEGLTVINTVSQSKARALSLSDNYEVAQFMKLALQD